MMSRFQFLAPVSAVILAGSLLAGCGQSEPAVTAQPNEPQMTVYKSPTCGCCEKWVDHVRSHGITVTVVDEPQMNPLKGSLGIPAELRSCHTAKIGGYLIEGHVPAPDIQRLLRERPAVDGLAVPGMPIGSPGMEMGDRLDAYTVIAFGGDQRSDFAHHGKAEQHPETHAEDQP